LLRKITRFHAKKTLDSQNNTSLQNVDYSSQLTQGKLAVRKSKLTHSGNYQKMANSNKDITQLLVNQRQRKHEITADPWPWGTFDGIAPQSFVGAPILFCPEKFTSNLQ